MAEKLTAYELGLLPAALAFAKENPELTRDELRESLACGSTVALHLQHYIQANEVVKISQRLGAIPETAEVRNTAASALGDTTTGYGHVIRENVRLQRALAREKAKTAAEQEARAQDIRAEIEELKTMAKEELKRPKQLTIRDTAVRIPSGNLLEVNLPDSHFGKQAWSPETGGAPYDSKIAQITYTQAIDALIERTKMYKYDEVLYVIGNDILNAENRASQTSHGTIVESDGRYQKTFWKARHTVIETVKKLLKIAPVKVMAVYGNHDQLSSWHLADSVECFFTNEKNVSVFNDPTYRKYYEFGKNMFMFTHGDKNKKENYPLLMAAEQSAMFGRTQFHEVHCGHTHETKTIEKNGVRVRVLPALCPADSWHSENGFVGNLRNAEAYIWNREQGLIGIAIYNVDSQPAVKTSREIV